jgi:HD-GYP domain-containing protein (c-di-GMP phosphodiesterase class II)
MLDLINCLSDTIDLVSPQLADHHNRVGLVAHAIACEMGLPEEERLDLFFAGNLHDIGALSLTDRLRLLTFEGCEPDNHAETGALLLEMFGPLISLGKLVRYHHLKWEDCSGGESQGRNVPFGSHILHLADRIAVLIGTLDGIHLLGRVPDIRATIKKVSGKMFAPVLVEAFNDLASKESFWLGLISQGRKPKVMRRAELRTISLDREGILGLSQLFARVIDFRSRFTTTHSSGVAACAEALARLSGNSVDECLQMRIAGLLHDLGKLAVPAELLEKKSDLTGEERAMIRSHTYFTRRALENIEAFELITDWGANHHERVDGTGYPYHVAGGELSAGSRIMAVADVFTAITEDRPYRSGMEPAAAKTVINNMVCQGALDSSTVTMLMKNYEELSTIRAASQFAAVSEYREISSKVAAVTA